MYVVLFCCNGIVRHGATKVIHLYLKKREGVLEMGPKPLKALR